MGKCAKSYAELSCAWPPSGRGDIRRLRRPGGSTETHGQEDVQPRVGVADRSEARIAKLKDGRTRLAYKPEHVVDLETGAILAAEVHGADVADPASVDAEPDARPRPICRPPAAAPRRRRSGGPGAHGG